LPRRARNEYKDTIKGASEPDPLFEYALLTLTVETYHTFNMSVYNSQLVTRLMNAIDRLHYSADYGLEDAFELYHKIQEQNERQAPSTDGIGLPALGHALAGSAGTALSHLILYPLDLVITRLQVQQQLKTPGEAPSAAKEADDAEYTSLADAAQKIYTHEGGLQAFWNGCATDTTKRRNWAPRLCPSFMN
jgi:hypothetical protein